MAEIAGTSWSPAAPTVEPAAKLQGVESGMSRGHVGQDIPKGFAKTVVCGPSSSPTDSGLPRVPSGPIAVLQVSRLAQR